MEKNSFLIETEKSLEEKSEKIKKRMSDGRDFHSICDDKDIYLGKEDANFLHMKFILNWEVGTLENFRKQKTKKK